MHSVEGTRGDDIVSRSEGDTGATDEVSLRARAALAEYHAACERAQSAPLGSPEFADAMRLVRSLCAELEGLNVDPAASWRESTRRTLRLPVPPHRPGQRARAARRSERCR
jgi:hypothetical protein